MTETCARTRVLMALATVALLTPSGLRAQSPDSRAASIAAEQARKAAALVPNAPSRAEQLLVGARARLLEAPAGVYPYFGSVYSGGGFTLGAGFRQFYGDRTRWDVKGLYSFKSYKQIELSTDSPGHAEGRLDFNARFGWRDATQVAYHGLGIDSPDIRSNFRMKQLYTGGDLAFRPAFPVVVGGGLQLEDYTLEEGLGTHPSIEEVHTSESAPGLGASPTFLHSNATGGIDWRPSPGYARRGGLYTVTYHNYADTDSTFTFDRLDAEIAQHIPILRENWVVSLHGLLQSTLNDDDAVPYFLLPSLGSGSTLRGYSSWRFRDRQSLLLSAEWRWIPNRLGLDMAIFYDRGIVTPRFHDLGWNGMKSNIGVGVRFHTLAATPLRIELARGDEGLRLVFAGSHAF